MKRQNASVHDKHTRKKMKEQKNNNNKNKCSKIGYNQYLNCKILRGGTRLQQFGTIFDRNLYDLFVLAGS